MSSPPSPTAAYRPRPTEQHAHLRRISLTFTNDPPDSGTLRSLFQRRSSSRFLVKRRAISTLLGFICLTALYLLSSWLSGGVSPNARSLRHTLHIHGSAFNASHEWLPSAYDQLRVKVGQLGEQYRNGPGAGAIRPPRREFVFQSSEDELGVLVGFLSAFASNALPTRLDPTKPLDPDLVLEFDPRTPTGNEEIQEHVRDVWMRYPVVLMVVTGGPDAKYTRRLIELFTVHFTLKPAPVILEIDRRGDSRVLIPLLQRLTTMPHFPLVFIGGEPILDVKPLLASYTKGTFESMLKHANVEVQKPEDLWRI